MHADANPFAAAEFADNPEPRCPCLLLLDVSGSMAGGKIEELNAGLKAFEEAGGRLRRPLPAAKRARNSPSTPWVWMMPTWTSCASWPCATR